MKVPALMWAWNLYYAMEGEREVKIQLKNAHKCFKP
jgi:hypothetical protein